MSEIGTAILRHPQAAALHAMWRQLRGDRVAPFRAELDAGRIGDKAPFLAIFEHVGPSNFRIRIAGDRLNRWFGIELRGMSALAMIEGPTRNHAQAALNRVVSDPAVAVLEGEARAMDGRSFPFEMVLMPMRSDFGRVDRVLAGLWLLGGAAPTSPVLLDAGTIRVLPVDVAIQTEPAPAPPLPPDGVAEAAAPEPAPGAASAPPQNLTPPEPPKGGPRRGGHLRLVKNG